jgi:hypothetical protein
VAVEAEAEVEAGAEVEGVVWQAELVQTLGRRRRPSFE